MRVSRTLLFSAVVVAELAVGLASQPTVISAAPATAEEINNNYQTVRSTKDSLGHKIFAQQQIVAKDNADVYRILAKKSDGSFQQIAATNDKHVLKKVNALSGTAVHSKYGSSDTTTSVIKDPHKITFICGRTIIE
ncbi:hypothetical protein ff3pr_00199 [Weissella cibaria]|uniref:hypothetical protein n=1 Tax=Weissella cibaria TaxID=137591 RepID=UPI0005B8440F|nr:hypothetical protein [Weissella cibaria]KIU24705.1 hypothetical protein ff3pr_00199 [Weissella cibaria]